jgi:hypothetical protein
MGVGPFSFGMNSVVLQTIILNETKINNFGGGVSHMACLSYISPY